MDHRIARSSASAPGHDLLPSPFLTWDESAQTMDLARNGYGPLHHDWRGSEVSE